MASGDTNLATLTMRGTLAMGANSITLDANETVDGIDVSAHAVANTGVHGIGASTFATAATLATHAAIKAANATLGHVIVETASLIDVDVNGKLTLGAHGATTHQNGQTDEFSVAALSGLLADDQHVLDNEVTAVAVARSIFNAHSLLIAISDNTPVVLEVAASRMIGRAAAGNIVALDKAGILGIINVEDGATADQTGGEMVTALEALAPGSQLSHDQLDDVSASDHHAKYLDSAAKAAAVQAGAITNGVTKAPTHDAVFDVKATADAAATDADLTTHEDNTTTAHGAVSAATASKHVVRDASARAKFAAPAGAGDALIKGTRHLIAEMPTLTTDKIWKGVGGVPTEADEAAGGAIVTSGQYTGNNTVNRTIPHGLGTTPKIVLLARNNLGRTYRIMGAVAQIQYESSNLIYAVTIPDGTNFYVGNATNYGNSANASSLVYDWVAIG